LIKIKETNVCDATVCIYALGVICAVSRHKLLKRVTDDGKGLYFLRISSAHTSPGKDNLAVLLPFEDFLLPFVMTKCKTIIQLSKPIVLTCCTSLGIDVFSFNRRFTDEILVLNQDTQLLRIIHFLVAVL
jgi:hypothetical protein